MSRRPLLLLPAALLLASCSCQQRLERLHARCPECFEAATVTDTIERHALHLDTVALLQWTPLGAAREAAIERHDLSLRLHLDADTVRISLDIPPDTVIVERGIPVPRTPCPDPPSPLPYQLALAALLLLLILLAIIQIKH